MERPFMNENHSPSWNRDALLENFAAEVTSAAYAVALRHDAEDKWLDLEIELWEALKETIKELRDELIRSIRMDRISNDHIH
jgi:RNA:NAD 2'-phosphotransferase (TPT1/KptA family)